jgi:hypothetical protein
MSVDAGAPFGPGALGVVRVQIAPGHYVAGLPQPRRLAVEQLDDLAASIARIGDTADLVAFDDGTGWTVRIRARQILTVDVVSTEDPSS